jgi:hypothetical protein
MVISSSNIQKTLKLKSNQEAAAHWNEKPLRLGKVSMAVIPATQEVKIRRITV